MIEGNYYTFKEAAKILGVTVTRAHALVKTYGITPHRVNPRFLLIPREELAKIPPKKERQRNNGRKLGSR